MAEKNEKEKAVNEQIRDFGQVELEHGEDRISMLTIIGEIEGHECLPAATKTTKYEHVLPQLAQIEDSCEVDGLLILIHTVGGDVEAGLAIAEMIAGMSIPSVTLVLGGSHSIGVPLAVSSDYSFIVPTGTMVIHPVRMNGMVIGVPQTFEYFKLIQDRITGFVCKHCKISLNINIFAVLAVTDYTETFIIFFDYINHCEVFDNRYVVKLLYRRQKM